MRFTRQKRGELKTRNLNNKKLALLGSPQHTQRKKTAEKEKQLSEPPSEVAQRSRWGRANGKSKRKARVRYGHRVKTPHTLSLARVGWRAHRSSVSSFHLPSPARGSGLGGGPTAGLRATPGGGRAGGPGGCASAGRLFVARPGTAGGGRAHPGGGGWRSPRRRRAPGSGPQQRQGEGGRRGRRPARAEDEEAEAAGRRSLAEWSGSGGGGVLQPSAGCLLLCLLPQHFSPAWRKKVRGALARSLARGRFLCPGAPRREGRAPRRPSHLGPSARAREARRGRRAVGALAGRSLRAPPGGWGGEQSLH